MLVSNSLVRRVSSIPALQPQTSGQARLSRNTAYVDGALVTTASQTFAIPADGSASITINYNGVSGISSGFVQDLRIYSRALPASEIVALSQPPLSAYPFAISSPPAPVAPALRPS